MSGATAFLALVVLVVVAVGSARTALRGRPAKVQVRARALIENSTGLLPGAGTQEVLQRIELLRRLQAAGRGVGAIASAIALLAAADRLEAGPIVLVALAGPWFGTHVGSMVAVVVTPPYAPGGSPAPIGLSDLLHPLQRVGMDAVALAAALLAVLAWPSGSPWLPAAVVCAAGAVLAAAGAEVVGRRLLRGRSGASDSRMWQDALRSVELRSLAAAPVGLGLVSILCVCCIALGGGRGAAVPVACAVVVALVASATLGRTTTITRRFLRRLWPDIARTAPAMRNPRFVR